MAIDDQAMEIQATQDSQVIDLSDAETIVISSDEEEVEDENYVAWMEFVRRKTRKLRRQLMLEACKTFLAQAPEELINEQ